MFRYYRASALLIASVYAAEATAKLSGIVVDDENKPMIEYPVQLSLASSQGNPFYAITDSKGQVSFNGLADGSYLLQSVRDPSSTVSATTGGGDQTVRLVIHKIIAPAFSVLPQDLQEFLKSSSTQTLEVDAVYNSLSDTNKAAMLNTYAIGRTVTVGTVPLMSFLN